MEEDILVKGDWLEPSSTDLVAQLRTIHVSQPVPAGWRVLTGTNLHSLIARVAYRYETEETDHEK